MQNFNEDEHVDHIEIKGEAVSDKKVEREFYEK